MHLTTTYFGFCNFTDGRVGNESKSLFVSRLFFFKDWLQVLRTYCPQVWGARGTFLISFTPKYHLIHLVYENLYKRIKQSLVNLETHAVLRERRSKAETQYSEVNQNDRNEC